MPLKLREDGDGKVRKVRILCFGRRVVERVTCFVCYEVYKTGEKEIHTSKEGLHVNSAHFPVRPIPEDEPGDADDALTIGEKFHFAVGFTRIVQLDSLGDSGPCTGFEAERTPTDGGTVRGVARGERGNVTLSFVGLVARGRVWRQIRIQLS